MSQVTEGYKETTVEAVQGYAELGEMCHASPAEYPPLHLDIPELPTGIDTKKLVALNPEGGEE